MTTQIDTIGCVSDEALARLWARDVSPGEEQALRRHLATCSACAARAERLAVENETWVGRLRRVGAPPGGATVVSAALTGDAVPGYQIEGEVARGGQGVIYRAVQLATRRVVAVKVLRDGALASDSARRRFQREIELIAGLRHPNLLTIYDAGVTRDGRAYFAMDYVEGQPLSHWIEGRASFSSATPSTAREALRPILSVFVRICDAVAYAHQRGVIHRDLKPSNVLIDAAGEPRVVDFGLARWIATERGPELTVPEQIAGTLPYMSPEQARGLPDAVDVRSDVYSLGVMIYHALTGRYPYPIETDTVVTLRHIAESAPTPPRRVAGALCDDELETIVLKALAKERERRYQSAGELGRDLERYLAGEPIEAKRDSTAYVIGKLLRRHRAAVMLSGAGLLLVLGLAVALAVMYARQSHLRSVAEARYQQVRALARSFIFDFDPLIRRLPGAAPARQLVVQRGLEYLANLAREAPADPVLQREIAAAYMSIGDIQADTTSSNLGQPTAAAASYRAAVRLLEGLGAGDPTGDPEPTVTLVMARLRLVDALLGQGDARSALDLCRSTHALTEQLRQRGADERFLDSHVDAMERLGNCLIATGDRPGGEALYEQVVQIAARLADEQPDDPERQRDLAIAYTKVAQARYAAGDLAGALHLYLRYVAITERLLEAGPNDVLALRDAGVGYQWVGILELESQRPQEALQPLEQSRVLLERLWSADAANAAAGSSLSATLTRLVEAQIALGQLDAAEQSAARNLEVSRALVDRSPDGPGVNRQYGVALYKLFELHQALARRDAADDDVRRQHQARACERLEACRSWFIELERLGKLEAADAGIPAALELELADCRKAIEAAVGGQRE